MNKQEFSKLHIREFTALKTRALDVGFNLAVLYISLYEPFPRTAPTEYCTFYKLVDKDGKSLPIISAKDIGTFLSGIEFAKKANFQHLPIADLSGKMDLIKDSDWIC